jgi:hypothetical protein
MQRIFAMIRAIMASIKVVMTPVWEAGKWTVRAVTTFTAPIFGAADTIVDAALSIPRKLFGGRGATTTGPQAAATAQAAAAQVQSAAAETARALTMQQTVGLAQRVANARAKGRDISEMASYLPPNLAEYIRALGTTECERFASADPRHIAEFISAGGRGKIEGVRSPAELFGNQSAPVPAPAADEVGRTPQERAVLSALAERLRAGGRVVREGTADNVLDFRAANG